jgi:hypothetical protein
MNTAYIPHGSYSVADECVVCRVLVSPGSHTEHEQTASHRLNAAAESDYA